MRDPLPEMAPSDAVILENFIPGTGGVQMRGGTQTRNTGAPGAVNTLLTYYPGSGAQQLFAVSGTGIYNVTAAGSFGAAGGTGLNSDKWRGVNFGTPGGQFLVAASGYDQPQIYNGTSWSPMTMLAPNQFAYTLDPTKLMNPAVFGNRLYFIERGSLRVWYLPLQAIQATGYSGSPPARVQATDTTGIIPTTCALVLDLSSQFTLGGSTAD